MSLNPIVSYSNVDELANRCIRTENQQNIKVKQQNSTKMKTTFLTILFLILAILVNAKVLTLSNDVHQPAMYKSLTDAYDAAQAGDTIYIYGSATSYGSIELKKKLTLIGSGFQNPNENLLKTTLGYIKFSYTTNNYSEVTSSSSGSIINGIYFGSIGLNGTDLISIKDILIKSCRFGYSYLDKKNFSMTMINCIIDGIHGGEFNEIQSGLIIKNSIITYRISGIKSNNYSIVLLNNTFLYIDSNGDNRGVLYDITGALISNNIFDGTGCYLSVNDSYLSNNIYTLKDELNGFNTEKQNHGTNNLVNTDPQFVRMPKLAFDYNYNYRLKDTSPGKNAGTDGTDIGITGGLYPWPVLEDGMMDFRGRPSLPYIDSIKILNPIIPSNGTLNILLKAKSQN